MKHVFFLSKIPQLLAAAALASLHAFATAQDTDLLLQQMEARQRAETQEQLAHTEEQYAEGELPEVLMLEAWPKHFPEMIEQALSTADWNTTKPQRILTVPESNPAPGEIWRINPLLYLGTIYPEESTLAYLAEQGVKTLVSLDVTPPDTLLARAYGMSWVHVPTTGHEVTTGNYLRIIRVFTFMEGNYYLHAGPQEYRAYPTAALAVKWMENRYSRAPLRPLYTLYALDYPSKYLSGWQSAVSTLALIQDQYQPLPANFASLNTERTLRPTMQQFQAWLDALQDSAEYSWNAPPHLAPRSAQEDAANIAELATRWAELSGDQDAALQQKFQETAAQARKMEKALSERKTPQGLNAALFNLENSCFACHQTTRDVDNSD